MYIRISTYIERAREREKERERGRGTGNIHARGFIRQSRDRALLQLAVDRRGPEDGAPQYFDMVQVAPLHCGLLYTYALILMVRPNCVVFSLPDSCIDTKLLHYY